MIERAWNLKDVMLYFNVKDSRMITQNFIKKKGLKFYRAGAEYRFRPKDVMDFEEQLKTMAQESLNLYVPNISVKRKARKIKVDFEKKKINLEKLRVI